MIQMFHIYKRYGADHAALVDVNLKVAKGEMVFLTGPSGAGKTTLLRLIFAAEQATQGQLLIDGQNIAKIKRHSIPALRRNIGVVFQDFKLLARRSVEDNVAITLEALGLSRKDVRRRSFAMLKRVGVAHKRHELPPTLSGGEQQRVAIARALVNEPKVLIADEPTGNLDADRAAEVMDLLLQANSRGTTVVVATHDPQLLDGGCHRVIRLQAGRVVAD